MKKKNSTNKKTNNDSLMRQAIRGRLLSLDFFARHWLKVMVVIVMILVYITNKYQYLTKLETIRNLEQELEIVKTERVRVRGEYMGSIRETSMSHLVDSMHLNLRVQEQPPFKINITN